MISFSLEAQITLVNLHIERVAAEATNRDNNTRLLRGFCAAAGAFALITMVSGTALFLDGVVQPSPGRPQSQLSVEQKTLPLSSVHPSVPAP